MITVSLKDVTLIKGNKVVLSKIDIDLFEGEQLTIFGNSEADILLAIIAGIIPPTQGDVEVLGHNLLKNRRQLLSQIGYIPPKPYIPSFMKVREYLELSIKMRGTKDQDQREQIKSSLEKLKLTELSDKPIRTLSDSEKKMVALASVFITHNKLFVLSNPFDNLSPHHRESVIEFLRTASKEGATCIFTSSTFDHLRETDKIAIMKDGKILAQGILKSLIQMMYDEQYLMLKVVDTKTVIDKLSKFPTVKKIGLGRDGTVKLWLKDFDSNVSSTIELLFSLNLGIRQVSIKQIDIVESCKQLYQRTMKGEHS
ncbi:MAG: ATP-binding cassette domain-containing protein [Nitrososphaerota archaeon]